MRFPGGGLFGGAKPPAPVAPPPLPPPVLQPDPDDPQIKIAARRKSTERRNKSGRLSTQNVEPETTGFG
jgi:hypothetical protein